MIKLFFTIIFGALMLWWYNHTWVHQRCLWWQYLILTVPFYLLGQHQATRWLLALAFLLTLTVQCLAWCGFIHLPIFKL